jgi:hypothetical protein
MPAPVSAAAIRVPDPQDVSDEQLAMSASPFAAPMNAPIIAPFFNESPFR